MIELRPHQTKALEEMKNGCILAGGVGTGKSLTALAYFYTQVAGGGIKVKGVSEWEAPTTPKDLYIITTAKKRDSLEWDHDALHLLLSRDPKLSISGIGVTVDSWNNIEKYKDVKGAFFIFDEQRLVGAGAWVKSFLKIAEANEWILLSATPGDTWMDYVPVFVANGYYKNRTEFIRNHVVYKHFSKFPIIDRYTEVPKLKKLRYRLLVEMPYVRHTTRHVEVVEVDYDKELFDRVWKERWHIYEDRPLRDVGEMFSVSRKVVNSDPSRAISLEELHARHPRLIVFYNFNYELDILRSLVQKLQEEDLDSEKLDVGGRKASAKLDSTTKAIRVEESSRSNGGQKTRSTSTDPLKDGTSQARSTPTSKAPTSSQKSTIPGTTSPLQVAEWNGQKHQPVPEGDRWIYLVQYTAGAEGWNCIATDAEVFFSLNYSWRVMEQAKGRIDRLNTPYSDLHYYILKSSAPIDKAIDKALTNKEIFNEKKFYATEFDLAA